MRYSALLFVFSICSVNAISQTVLKSGTHVVVAGGTTVRTSEGLAISETANLENNGTVVFERDLTNDGNTELGGTFVAEGTDDQNIGGLPSFSMNTLVLNSTYNTTLTSRVEIANELDLQQGILYTNATNPVIFSNTAKDPVETIDGYINGTAIMFERNLHSSNNSFLGSEIMLSSGDNIGPLVITRTTGDDAIMSIGENKSIAAKWVFHAMSSLRDVDMSVKWLPVFDNHINPNVIGLYGNTKFDSNRYVLLDVRDNNPVWVNPSSQTRIYRRNNLDFIGNRTLTLANKNSLDNTMPDVNITMFPNPMTDQINLLLENFETWAHNASIKITNYDGKMFYEGEFPINGNQITINNLGFLPVGDYHLYVSRGQLTKVVTFSKLQ